MGIDIAPAVLYQDDQMKDLRIERKRRHEVTRRTEVYLLGSRDLLHKLNAPRICFSGKRRTKGSRTQTEQEALTSRLSLRNLLCSTSRFLAKVT